MKLSKGNTSIFIKKKYLLQINLHYKCTHIKCNVYPPRYRQTHTNMDMDMSVTTQRRYKVHYIDIKLSME